MSARDFATLDRLRATAGIAPKAFAREARVPYLRYLKIRLRRARPTGSELARLKRALARRIGLQGRAA